LTGGQIATVGTPAFRRLLLGRVLAADRQYVGVLLPPSVGGVLANTALALSGKGVGQPELYAQ
jgi:acyl-[acyl-carrier-protein]-phospholipid O-acyltransferase/long-chain-fatty-acid--[acyl-carrier-protein] ligase